MNSHDVVNLRNMHFFLGAHVIDFHTKHQDTLLKEEDMLRAIAYGVERRCQCGFRRRQFLPGTFQCFQESANGAVTYRTMLEQKQGAAVNVVESISSWVRSRPSISVRAVFLQVDSSCALSINSFEDPECTTGVEMTKAPTNFLELVTSPSVESNEQTVSIEGTVGIFVVIVLVLFGCLLAAILIISVILWKKFKAKSNEYT